MKTARCCTGCCKCPWCKCRTCGKYRYIGHENPQLSDWSSENRIFRTGFGIRWLVRHVWHRGEHLGGDNAAESEELAELELGDCCGPFIEYFTLKTFVSKFYHNSAKLRIYPVEPSWMGTLPPGYPFGIGSKAALYLYKRFRKNKGRIRCYIMFFSWTNLFG